MGRQIREREVEIEDGLEAKRRGIKVEPSRGISRSLSTNTLSHLSFSQTSHTSSPMDQATMQVEDIETTSELVPPLLPVSAWVVVVEDALTSRQICEECEEAGDECLPLWDFLLFPMYPSACRACLIHRRHCSLVVFPEILIGDTGDVITQLYAAIDSITERGASANAECPNSSTASGSKAVVSKRRRSRRGKRSAKQEVLGKGCAAGKKRLSLAERLGVDVGES